MQEGYPVYERFHSWQGEGLHLGKSAFFIRLHGCPVHCPGVTQQVPGIRIINLNRLLG